jgi:hypothetical protein
MVSHHHRETPVDEATIMDRAPFVLSVSRLDIPSSTSILPAPPYCSQVRGEDLITQTEHPLDGTLVDITQPLISTIHFINWDASWHRNHFESGVITQRPDRKHSGSNQSEWSRPPTPPPPYSAGNSPTLQPAEFTVQANPPPQMAITSHSATPTEPSKLHNFYEVRMAKYADMIEQFLGTLQKTETLRHTPEPPVGPGDVGSINAISVRRNSPYRSDFIPLSLVEQDCMTVISYRACMQPRKVTNPSPKENPQIKLGGVWMELGDQIIANLVERTTSVKIRHADMFRCNQGRCSLFLENPEKDTDTVIRILNRRLWLGPPGAIFAHSEAAAERLQRYIHEMREKSMKDNFHWPRHLLTAERWFTKAEYRKLPHHRTAPSLLCERLRATRSLPLLCKNATSTTTSPPLASIHDASVGVAAPFQSKGSVSCIGAKGGQAVSTSNRKTL